MSGYLLKAKSEKATKRQKTWSDYFCTQAERDWNQLAKTINGRIMKKYAIIDDPTVPRYEDEDIKNA